jgi:hypothetical protein
VARGAVEDEGALGGEWRKGEGGKKGRRREVDG